MRWASLLREALAVEGVVFEHMEVVGRGSVVFHARPRERESRRCSVCGQRCPLYDRGWGRRRWRALDLGTLRIDLEAEVPRVRCRRHGVVVAKVPWARRQSGFTISFENTIAWWATQASKAAVTRYMRIAWRTVGSILTRVTAEQEARRGGVGELRCIGVDDKSYRRGHRYITLVVDHDRGRLVWAAPGRSAQVLRGFFDMIGEEATRRIEVVSRDAGPWITTVLDERCPGAVQCMDPFHVVGWATEAVELTRRDQARSFRFVGMSSRAKYLKGTRWIVRTGMENLTQDQQAGLEDLAALNQPLYRAYLLKEQLRSTIHEGGDSGCALVTAWIDWAAESDLPYMIEVAKRVASNIEAIHAALRHRISNARTEAFNTRLQLINRRAYGLHSAQALIALAMLDLGRLCPPLPGRHDPTHDYVT